VTSVTVSRDARSRSPTQIRWSTSNAVARAGAARLLLPTAVHQRPGGEEPALACTYTNVQYMTLWRTGRPTWCVQRFAEKPDGVITSCPIGLSSPAPFVLGAARPTHGGASNATGRSGARACTCLGSARGCTPAAVGSSSAPTSDASWWRHSPISFIRGSARAVARLESTMGRRARATGVERFPSDSYPTVRGRLCRGVRARRRRGRLGVRAVVPCAAASSSRKATATCRRCGDSCAGAVSARRSMLGRARAPPLPRPRNLPTVSRSSSFMSVARPHLFPRSVGNKSLDPAD